MFFGWGGCLLLTLLFCLPVFNQTVAPIGTGKLAGRVVGEHGRPLPDAAVTIHAARGASTTPRSTVSNDEGEFSFTDVPMREYYVNAVAPGYVAPSLSSGIFRPGSVITLTLVKGGVITGRVTNALDQPVVFVRVSALMIRDKRGRRVPSNVGLYSQPTDDRGVYRVYGLEEGTYLVLANAPETYITSVSAFQNETPTYYPSADRAAAEEVSVRPGDEARDIHIRYRGERGHTLSGKVAGAIEFKEAGSGGVSVTLKHLASNTIYSETGVAILQGKTEFSFHPVPDGEYELLARRFSHQMPPEEPLSAPRRVQVKNADVTGVTLTLLPQGSVAGRLIVAASAPELTCAPTAPLALETVTLTAWRAVPKYNVEENRGNPMVSAKADAQGGFVLGGLAAGTYALRFGASQGTWYLQSLTGSAAAGQRAPVSLARTGLSLKQGENLTGVTVTLAAGAASLSGRVLPVDGQALPERMRLHLIPAESTAADDLLRYAETPAQNQAGRFGFDHLAPGRYRLYVEAVTVDAPDYRTASFAAWEPAQRARLRRLAASQPEIELKACEQRQDVEVRLAARP